MITSDKHLNVKVFSFNPSTLHHNITLKRRSNFISLWSSVLVTRELTFNLYIRNTYSKIHDTISYSNIIAFRKHSKDQLIKYLHLPSFLQYPKLYHTSLRIQCMSYSIIRRIIETHSSFATISFVESLGNWNHHLNTTYTL